MLVNYTSGRKVYEWLINNLVRPCCTLCAGAALRSSGLCSGCAADLPRLSGPLCRCGLPMLGASTPHAHHWPGLVTATPPQDDDDASLAPLCGRCLGNPPPFLGVQALWRYATPVDQLLNNWKHRRHLAAERVLLQEALAGLPLLPHVDAIVAMPLYWQRQAWRGFNQAGRFAAAVADAQRLPLLPALRQQQRHHQQGASRRARFAQRAATFRCTATVSGLHLLLVDDVVTTTASCRAASTCLLAAGAASISVLALARTLPAGDH